MMMSGAASLVLLAMLCFSLGLVAAHAKPEFPRAWQANCTFQASDVGPGVLIQVEGAAWFASQDRGLVFTQVINSFNGFQNIGNMTEIYNPEDGVAYHVFQSGSNTMCQLDLSCKDDLFQLYAQAAYNGTVQFAGKKCTQWVY